LAIALDSDANALAMANHQRDWINFVGSTWSYWQLHDVETALWNPGGFRPENSSLINGPDLFGGNLLGDPSAAAPFFTCAAGTPGTFTWHFQPTDASGFTPSNGDKLFFPAVDNIINPVTPPCGLSNAKPYYAVRVAGNSGQLATTPGGTPIAL